MHEQLSRLIQNIMSQPWAPNKNLAPLPNPLWEQRRISLVELSLFPNSISRTQNTPNPHEPYPPFVFQAQLQPSQSALNQALIQPSQIVQIPQQLETSQSQNINNPIISDKSTITYQYYESLGAP